MFTLNNTDHTLLKLALQEDMHMPFVDVTSQTLLGDYAQTITLHIDSKEAQPMVLCGLPIIHAILDAFQKPYRLHTTYEDGDIISPKKRVLTLEGDACALLMAERTILNILRHLSAIATLTKRFVDAVQGTSAKILDTRKTTPGMRHMEKYAVHCGGGVNHRMGLYDAYMVKDNHVDLLGGVEKALAKLPPKSENPLPVIFEVRDIEELKTVIQHGQHIVTRVLLDNMPPNTLRECVALCDHIFDTEASGNVSLETVRDVANTGVDYISIGMLTYAAGQLDLSMRQS